jgi:chemotaxis protein CheX
VNTSDELVAPLTTAIEMALREMAGVELGARRPGPSASAALTATLPVTTATGTGTIALGTTESVATELARRVLAAGGAATEPDAALVRDCLGELVNVIAGQAKVLLFGTPYHFMLSTPRVQNGALIDDGATELAFGSEIGEFVLRVRLPV